MANNEAGEKKLPPTPIKLRKLRREGQVPNAADFRGGASLIFVFVFLLLAGPAIVDQMRLALVAGVDAAAGPNAVPVDELAWAIAGLLAGPAFGAIVVSMGAFALASVIDMQGVLISFKRLSLDFKRLNPVEGIKRKFSMSAFAEFARGVLKAAIVAGAMYFQVRAVVSDLYAAPTCGLDCVGGVTLVAVLRMLATLVVLQALASLLDLRLSRALFRHENRMSEAEVKREMREEYGAPELRRARKRIQADAARAPIPRGLRNASVVFVGPDVAVALAASKTFQFAPVVVAKASGAQEIAALLRRAGEFGVPAYRQAEAAATLVDAPVNYEIPERAYSTVAQALMSVRFFN